PPFSPDRSGNPFLSRSFSAQKRLQRIAGPMPVKMPNLSASKTKKPFLAIKILKKTTHILITFLKLLFLMIQYPKSF
ncbi:MAG TPA: hypothetical protein VFS71_19885, partial [Flavobacterium sp.]|uniref:hypothetical protein n=1 Tax=Flavobacterium sp. TaxID=239 RepID=UPI002DB7D620